jgi:hypothetical protein
MKTAGTIRLEKQESLRLEAKLEKWVSEMQSSAIE